MSKSANYCATSKRNNTGLLLLCDVALGNMYERNKIGILELFLIPIDNLLFQCVYPEYVEKLDPCLHSTKGVGKTEPDPAGTKELDGFKVNNFDLDLSSSFLSPTVNK